MPRIKLFDPATMTEAQRPVYEAILRGPRGRLVGPLRAVLLVPELADVWQQFGAKIRFGLSVPTRASELAIIVTARHWHSQLEWQVHAKAALAEGVPSAVIEAIRNGATPNFDDRKDADVYAFTRELLATGDVSDAAHGRICDHWQDAGAVELTAAIGYYTMVSLMLNAQGIPPLEDGSATMPPIGDGSVSLAANG